MTDNKNKWSVGEIVSLPRQVDEMKHGSRKWYKRYVWSRYICIREEAEGQRGILLKVLGKVDREYIEIVSGEPFCRDDSDERFTGVQYLSYTFPTERELKDVLDILHGNKELLATFEEAKMHVNPDSTFWVNEIKRRVFLKMPQYYNAYSGQVCLATDYTPHYRVTLAYFYKGELIW